MTKTERKKRKKKSVLFKLMRMLLLLAVIDLILLIVLRLNHQTTHDDLPAGTDDTDLTARLTACADENRDYKPLLDHPENYPEELLELAVKNPEALHFVLDYPEKKDEPAAQTIQELEDGEIPHLFQWDERWGCSLYGEHTLAVSGCGPTCLSMVASGLTGDNTLTPAVVADWSESHGHYVSGNGSSWSLMTEGAEHFGLTATELPLDETTMKKALEAGKPIILSVREGDFTTSGHFIVLCGAEDEQFRIYDPNSQALSDRLWDYETLAPQIRNLWSFEIS